MGFVWEIWKLFENLLIHWNEFAYANTQFIALKHKSFSLSLPRHIRFVNKFYDIIKSLLTFTSIHTGNRRFHIRCQILFLCHSKLRNVKNFKTLFSSLDLCKLNTGVDWILILTCTIKNGKCIFWFHLTDSHWFNYKK